MTMVLLEAATLQLLSGLLNVWAVVAVCSLSADLQSAISVSPIGALRVAVIVFKVSVDSSRALVRYTFITATDEAGASLIASPALASTLMLAPGN